MGGWRREPAATQRDPGLSQESETRARAPSLTRLRRSTTRKYSPRWARQENQTEKYMKRNQNICSLAREALARLTEDKENLNNLKFVEISIICYYSCRF